MKKNLLFCLFAMMTMAAIGQQLPGMGGAMGGGSETKIYDGKISGIVLDSATQKPAEFANIALYKAGGSSKALDGAMTDEKGAFRLKNIKNGKYKVTVSFLGFETQTFDNLEIADKKLSVDLGKISISPNAKMLSEAVVEGEKSLIETKIDKIVYNAEKDLTSKGGNATDVLRKVPMVTVDLDGNVSLQGSGNVKVLINNKPSSIMASSVAEAMKMIPADEIEKVEVITSPSAKYDAEGTGGIINIITKKKNVEGMSGSVNVGAGTRSSNLYGSMNYRKGRFGTGLNIGGFGYRGTGNLSTTRETATSLLTQSGKNTNLGAGPFVQWTTDYDLTSKNNFSTSFRVRNFYHRTTATTGNDIVTTSPIVLKSHYDNKSKIKTDGLNYDANLDYKRTFKQADRELTASVQISDNMRNTDYDVTQFYDTLSRFESSINKSTNMEVTYQTDYVHPFSKKFTFETGAKNIVRDVLSEYDYSTEESRNNSFDYSQIIYAGYAQTSLSFTKFGIKTGLRYEQTTVEGHNVKQSYDTTFGSDYENWVPNVTLSYRKAGVYNLKLAYTQRIQRPSMNYLNPYVNRSDALNISYGNPELDAEQSHSFEFGYSLFKKFGSINTSLFHRFTNNAIESVRFIDSKTATGTYVTTYDNIGKNRSTGGSISTNVIWKKLMLASNFNIYYYEVESTDTTISSTNHGVNYNINLFGSYKMTERWSVQAFGNFNGPRYSIQGKSTSFFYYNLSARREFKNQKGGIGAGLDNFFTPYMHFKSDYSGKDFTYNSDNKMFFFGARISFDYRFGKMEFKAPKKKGIRNDDLKDGEGDGMGGMPGGGR